MIKRLGALVGLMTVVGFCLSIATPHTLVDGGWTPLWIVTFVLLTPAMVLLSLLALGLLIATVIYIVRGD